VSDSFSVGSHGQAYLQHWAVRFSEFQVHVFQNAEVIGFFIARITDAAQIIDITTDRDNCKPTETGNPRRVMEK